MRLFSRQKLDPTTSDDLARHLGRTPREVSASTLAHASGDGVVVVALRDLLAVRQDAVWRTWAWQEVQAGDWSGEHQTLTMRFLDGDREQVELSDPGQVPSVFAERVQSSILVEERVRVPGGEVVVSGRRPPVAASTQGHAVVWHALSVGRVDLNAPGVRDAVLRATERLKADYEL